MPRKNLYRLGIIALFIAWYFDQLFWKKTPGVSFFLFVLICLAGGILLTLSERLRPARTSLLLIIPVLSFAALTFLRQEPFTQMVAYGLTLVYMGILALTWLGGRWWEYSLSDYVLNFLRLAGLTLLKPAQAYLPASGKAGAESASAESAAVPPALQGSGPAAGPRPGSNRWQPLGSILFGLLLTLPVIAVLAALLAEADPVFARYLQDVLSLFRIEKLAEYIFRFIYILIGAYLLAGVYLFALLSSRQEKLTGIEKPWLPPFLGWVEAVVMLACVDLLFSFFVGVQFRYFFGGQTNIAVESFTYSEYARRGFGELAAVALISLCLFLGLGLVTRREQPVQRRTFSILGTGLVALVAVILVSAFQRLLLYEAAYGFSRVRAYTHVFMVWLGLLLLAAVALELVGRLRLFALAVVLACLGFGLSLGLLNVDGFIARQNIARAVQGAELDSAYLVSLSEDATPDLFDSFGSGQIPDKVHNVIGGVLACRAALAEANLRPQVQSWPSFQWPRWNALRLYQAHQAELEAYPVEQVNGEWMVQSSGETSPCEKRLVMEEN